MRFVGTVPKWRKVLPTGVVQFVLAWQASPARIIPEGSQDRSRRAVLDAFLENLEMLRSCYPHAYVLTNRRAPQDPTPPWSGRPHRLEPRMFEHLPHARIAIDPFAAPDTPRDEHLSYLIEYGREDLGAFLPDLLGERPSPLQAALLLAQQTGLCPWVEEQTRSAPDSEEWKARLLTRFQIYLWGHERELLFVETKAEGLVEFPS